MLIGIIADTHDNLPMTKRAVHVLADRGAGMLVHCGDYAAPFTLQSILRSSLPFVGVLGNNDGERKGLSRLGGGDLHEGAHRMQIDGISIVTAHEPELLSSELTDSDDVGLCGHTHHPEIATGAVLIINPGEAGGWLTGRCTAALLNTGNLHTEIVELGNQDRG